MRKLHYLTWISLCLATFAQASLPVDPLDKTVNDEVNLREIEINASRTQTRMKELPASVTVLAANVLEKNEISALNSISALVPNFFMPDYGTKLTSPVYIRGIGSRINSPSVGMYVDNVPYFEK